MIQYYIEVELEVRKQDQIIEKDRKLFLIKENQAIQIE